MNQVAGQSQPMVVVDGPREPMSELLRIAADERPASELAFLRDDLVRYRQGGRLKWYDPPLWSLCDYRFRRWGNSFRWRFLRKFFRILTAVPYSILRLLTGIELPTGARIGPGLRIWHFGGIVLHPETVIGRNCTIRHEVTIGSRHDEHDVPVLGDDVDIGAGAKVLGRIRIGNRVSIGANAVVLDDVPDDHIAVGVPARILPARKAFSDSKCDVRTQTVRGTDT